MPAPTILNTKTSTSLKYGGDALNNVNNFLNGVNVTSVIGTPIIRTPTKIPSDILKFTDPAEDNTVTIKIPALSADKTINLIPSNVGADDEVLFKDTVQTVTGKVISAGTNTITGLANANLSGAAGITDANLATITDKAKQHAQTAYKDAANIFTGLQSVEANIDPSLEVYKTSNSGNIGIDFYAQSSTSVKRRYAALDVTIATNTNADEDSYVTLGVIKDGTLGTKFLFNHNGNFYLRPGTSGAFGIIDSSLISTTDKAFTLPNITGNLLTDNSTATNTNKTILDSGTGNQIGVHVPYTFTIYQTASNYIVRNNLTGTLQSFANTDFATALEWAIDNMVNVGLGTQSSLYGGGIFLQRGKYVATSTINHSITTATRHGMTIAGEGWGTEVALNPSGAQTDGFLIDLANFTLKDMRITANANVTNLIHVIGHGSGERRNDHTFLYNLQIEGPNVSGGWNATAHVANQVGILFDGTEIANYYSRIKDCYIHSFEKGIWFKGAQTTSCLMTGGALKWCETGIEISDSAGQIFINNIYIQGDTFDGTTGIHVTSTAGGYIQISNINAEMHRENPPGTPVTAQAVLIDSGVANCSVKTVRNAYDGVDANWKTVVDNSWPTTLNDTPATINIKNKNFFYMDYDNNRITVNSGREMIVSSDKLRISNASGWLYIQRAGAIVASRIVSYPVLGADDTFVFQAHTQTLTNKTLTSPTITTPTISSIVNTGTLTLPTATDTLVGRATTDTLTNKSISGSTNTITNVPDSALSANVPLINAANSFTEFQKITKTSAATDSLLTLYKPSNTAADRVSLDFSMNNSTPAEVVLASIRSTAATFTAGSENGQLEIWTKNTGTMARRFVVNQNGTLNFGSNLRVILTETGLTAGRTFTFPDATTTLVGADTTQTISNKTYSGFTMSDATNIVLNTTTGTKIGTGTTQKLGFYNATPIAQGASITDISTSATGTEIATAVNALISRLELLGLIATV